jgi:hypothetical protein
VVYEQRVYATHVHRGIYGTVDCLIYDPVTRKLWVVDFKYGQGIAVEVVWNPQMLIYAVGALHRHGYAVAVIELVIVQPRAAHPDGPVRRWEIDSLDLVVWEAELQRAALATDDPNAEAHAGEHCRFCPALYRCEDARARVLELLGANWRAFDGELRMQHLPDPKKLTPDEEAKLLREVSIIKSYVKRVEEHAHGRALGGDMPTGFKFVEGRSLRRWTDVKHAEETLLAMGFDESDLYAEPKFLTPAAAEALIGNKKEAEKRLSEYWEKPKGKLTLAPVEDARPAASYNVGAAFGAVTEDDDI